MPSSAHSSSCVSGRNDLSTPSGGSAWHPSRRRPMALIDMWGRLLGDSHTEREVVMTLEALHAARENGVLPRPAAVQLPPDTTPEAIAPWLAELDLVCIEVPKFPDGRGFTLAR